MRSVPTFNAKPPHFALTDYFPSVKSFDKTAADPQADLFGRRNRRPGLRQPQASRSGGIGWTPQKVNNWDLWIMSNPG